MELSTPHITRPLLRYHGGKFKLAEWIISFFPEHHMGYTECFGGAGSVLLKKPRSKFEIYNDLDGEVVNVFKVCRDRSKELMEVLRYTPYAREEFDLSYQAADDDLERARRMIVRSFFTFSPASISGRITTGFRGATINQEANVAEQWASYPDCLQNIVQRLQGVVIENDDWKKVTKRNDKRTTLHYLDPTYVASTRYKGNNTKCYRHEMTDDDHVEMCEFVKFELEGFRIISGYENEIYSHHLKDWTKVSKTAHADHAKDRIETIWISPNVPIQSQGNLF